MDIVWVAFEFWAWSPGQSSIWRGGVGRFSCDWCVFWCRKRAKINRATYLWAYPYHRPLSTCLSPTFPEIVPLSFEAWALLSLTLEHIHSTDVHLPWQHLPLSTATFCHPKYQPCCHGFPRVKVGWQIGSAWSVVSWVWDRNWGAGNFHHCVPRKQIWILTPSVQSQFTEILIPANTARPKGACYSPRWTHCCFFFGGSA